MAEYASKGVKHGVRSGLQYLKMKVGGHITRHRFQDEFSREKVKLSGRSGKLAQNCETSWGEGLKVVA